MKTTIENVLSDLRLLGKLMKLKINKVSMFEINQNLNVFESDAQELNSPMNDNKNTYKNGSAHKTASKRKKRYNAKKPDNTPKSK